MSVMTFPPLTYFSISGFPSDSHLSSRTLINDCLIKSKYNLLLTLVPSLKDMDGEVPRNENITIPNTRTSMSKSSDLPRKHVLSSRNVWNEELNNLYILHGGGRID